MSPTVCGLEGLDRTRECLAGDGEQAIKPRLDRGVGRLRERRITDFVHPAPRAALIDPNENARTRELEAASWNIVAASLPIGNINAVRG